MPVARALWTLVRHLQPPLHLNFRSLQRRRLSAQAQILVEIATGQKHTDLMIFDMQVLGPIRHGCVQRAHAPDLPEKAPLAGHY